MSWQTQARQAGWHSDKEWTKALKDIEIAIDLGQKAEHRSLEKDKKIADLERQLAEANATLNARVRLPTFHDEKAAAEAKGSMVGLKDRSWQQEAETTTNKDLERQLAESKRRDIEAAERMIADLEMKIKRLNQDLEDLIADKSFWINGGKNEKTD